MGLAGLYGSTAAGAARGLALRMDHGSQYLSDHFTNQIKFWGIQPSYAFVAEPQTNGVAERLESQILAEVLPDVLDRVQLGRARWQQDDGEVLGDLERVGAVPPGAVHQDDAMGLGGDVAADLVEMHLHGGCVGEGEHESGTLGSHGTDCAKEVGVRVALIGGQAWPCSLLRPNAHTPVLLSRPGRVLEPDLDPLGLGQTG